MNKAVAVRHELRSAVAILLLATGLVGTAVAVSGGTAGAQGNGAISIQPTDPPVYDFDAPDPAIVRDGSVYYAFTTGTDRGNNLQALVDTSGSPLSGWNTYTGTTSGSTALPFPPAWETPSTQTSPGVFHWNGKWMMYYDAASNGQPGDTGSNCLSVATADALTPGNPVFTDNSTHPLLCQPNLGGAIDPSPFVDPATGNAYLLWKSNDGGSTGPARLWSQQLSADGMTLVGSPTQLLIQNGFQFPWETTVENPDMAEVGGTYFLLFSAGTYDSTGYSEAFATCAGPVGPCTQSQAEPFLTSYGSAAGPGGGSFFKDASGNWLLAYAAWLPGCTAYVDPSCVGARRMFVAPIEFTPASLPTPVTGMASTPTGDGYWLVNTQGGISAHAAAQSYGSMAGQALNAPVEHIVATPDGKGYWLVAADGGTFAFGDAGFYGSMGGRPLNAPVVSMTPTKDGKGYWLVAADGGIFSFGDAQFHGSMGGTPLNASVVGMAADAGTGGYWLVGADGGIFSFGAPFYGAD
jgi:hypothetical protein